MRATLTEQLQTCMVFHSGCVLKTILGLSVRGANGVKTIYHFVPVLSNKNHVEAMNKNMFKIVLFGKDHMWLLPNTHPECFSYSHNKSFNPRIVLFCLKPP